VSGLGDETRCRIRAALRASGRTHRDLAAALGLSEASVSHYTNGRRVPSGQSARLVVAELGDWLDDTTSAALIANADAPAVARALRRRSRVRTH